MTVPVRSLIFSVLIILLLAQSGCIYIPTAEHDLLSGRAMIKDNDLRALELGLSTRADVLLTFGDPTERLYEDQIFCYRWERIQGVVGIGYGYANVGKVHYACAQFDSNSVLVRVEHIEAFMFGDADKKRDKTLDGWLTATAAPSTQSDQPLLVPESTGAQ